MNSSPLPLETPSDSEEEDDEEEDGPVESDPLESELLESDPLEVGSPLGSSVGLVPALPVGLLEAVLLGEEPADVLSLGLALALLEEVADEEAEDDPLGVLVAEELAAGLEDAAGVEDLVAAPPAPELVPSEEEPLLEGAADARGV